MNRNTRSSSDIRNGTSRRDEYYSVNDDKEDESSAQESSTKKSGPDWRLLVAFTIILGIIGAAIYTVILGKRKTAREIREKEEREKTIALQKTYRTDLTNVMRKDYDIRTREFDRTRRIAAKAIFGFETAQEMLDATNANRDGVGDTAAFLKKSSPMVTLSLEDGQVGKFLDTTEEEALSSNQENDAGGGGAGTNRNDAGKPKTTTLNLAEFAAKLCPSPTYTLLSLASMDANFGCFMPCQPGYEQITFAPRDANNLPLKIHPIDPITGEPDLTKLEEVPPSPWCRAKCPIKLYPPSDKAFYRDQYAGISSDYLDDGATPKYIEALKDYERTDIGDNAAFCSRATQKRSLLRGGENIICGWCTQDIDTGKGNATSTNRNTCGESNGIHYGMYFTQWCQRRRLIPSFRPENITGPTDDNKEDITDVAMCAGIGGKLGGAKTTQWIEGPKACKGNAELLPIQSAGYFNRNSTGLVKPLGHMFSGTNQRPLQQDEIVVSFAKKDAKAKDNPKIDYSMFGYGCFTSCPIFMIPIGPVEKHMCGETCPPNTLDMSAIGEFGMCHKMAFLMQPVYDNFMLVLTNLVQDYAVWLKAKHNGQVTAASSFPSVVVQM